MIHGVVQLAYIVATALFVFALHWMNAPGDRAARRVRRRGRHGARGRRHLGPARGGPPPLDRHRDRGRVRGRHSALPGAAHRGAPADRAVARLRRTGRRPGRHRQVLPLARRGPGEPHRVPDGRHHRRDHPGLPDLHRQPHGGGQAAGGEMDPPAAGDLSAAERHQHRPAGRRGRRWASALVLHPTAAVGADRVSRHHRAGAALRRAADHPDRRRRHADGDRDPQLLRRPLGGRDGVRAGQQAADHRGRARRLQRPDPRHHHVQGDEPLVHQRAVRRLRPGAAGQGGRRGEGLQGRRRIEGAGAGAGAGQPGGHHPRLRHGGGAGAAQGARALRPAQEARDHGQVRHPPGGRAGCRAT